MARRLTSVDDLVELGDPVAVDQRYVGVVADDRRVEYLAEQGPLVAECGVHRLHRDTGEFGDPSIVVPT